MVRIYIYPTSKLFNKAVVVASRFSTSDMLLLATKQVSRRGTNITQNRRHMPATLGWFAATSQRGCVSYALISVEATQQKRASRGGSKL